MLNSDDGLNVSFTKAAATAAARLLLPPREAAKAADVNDCDAGSDAIGAGALLLAEDRGSPSQLVCNGKRARQRCARGVGIRNQYDCGCHRQLGVLKPLNICESTDALL